MTQAIMTTLERYLQGQPLNDELAALKRGEEPLDAEQLGGSTQRPSPFAARELDDDDREHLRRLTLEPGWGVMLMLLDNDIQHQENLAKVASLNDPLGKRNEIADYWAYVSMAKRTRDRMMWLISEEIGKLGHEQTLGK